MEENLPDLIQETIDALARAQAQLANLIETMRNQNVDLDSEFTRIAEEKARIQANFATLKYLVVGQNGHSG